MVEYKDNVQNIINSNHICLVISPLSQISLTFQLIDLMEKTNKFSCSPIPNSSKFWSVTRFISKKMDVLEMLYSTDLFNWCIYRIVELSCSFIGCMVSTIIQEHGTLWTQVCSLLSWNIYRFRFIYLLLPLVMHQYPC